MTSESFGETEAILFTTPWNTVKKCFDQRKQELNVAPL